MMSDNEHCPAAKCQRCLDEPPPLCELEYCYNYSDLFGCCGAEGACPDCGRDNWDSWENRRTSTNKPVAD